MYIRCVFLMAPFLQMVVKPLFSVFKGAEECLYPIAMQLPVPTPHGTWGGLQCTAEAHCGCTALVSSCQMEPTVLSEKPIFHFPSRHAPAVSLCQPQHPGSHLASQFSKLRRLKINPTKRERKKEGRIVPRPIIPWRRWPYSQRSTSVSRGERAAFWQETSCRSASAGCETAHSLSPRAAEGAGQLLQTSPFQASLLVCGLGNQ